jgi:metallo-beta-lactamase family protein
MIESTAERAARMKALAEKAAYFTSNPWILYHEPFQVTDNIYFVGNTYVSTYLIDTGDGLILIDPAFKESVYLVFDGIRKLGFHPEDIKHIFLSHGHFDHVAATRFLQEYTKAKVWISENDAFFFTERPDLICGEIPPFTISEYYDYSKPFEMGNVKIEFKLCAGHTPGTTTFVIHTSHHGKPVIAAMHGGLGLNGLTYEELEENRLPAHLQADYVNQLREMMKLHVDIVIPSHNHNYDLLSRYKNDDGSGDIYLDPTRWQTMLQEMLEKAKSVIPDQFS